MSFRPIRTVRRRVAERRHIPAWWHAWRNRVLAAQNSPPLVNVAVHGIASQSSISDGDDRHGPMTGISGRTDSEQFFATQYQANPWWMVDLRSGWPVDVIRLHNRPDAESRRACRIMVSVSADGQDWTTVLAGVHFFGDADAPGPLEIRLRGVSNVRFVRLELPDSGVLSLRQVEILVEPYLIDLRTTCQRYGFNYAAMAQRRFGSEARHCYAVDRASQPFDGAIDAIHVSHRIGRFGNHVKMLILATCLARRLGAKRIYLTRLSQFDITEPLEADGITLLPERMLAEETPGVVLSGAFYYQDVFGDYISRIEARESEWAVRNFLRPLFWHAARTPPFTPADTDLAIHIRSGDVFRDARPHPGYVQPPLGYYRLVVRHAQQTLGIQRVILVYEDELNPCIGALKQSLQEAGMPFVSQSASLEDDLSVLLHAPHCVFGHGSFGPAIIHLSRCMRTVFTFWTQPDVAEIARSVGVRPIFVHDLAGRYIKPGAWTASPEQRQAMLDYPIENMALDEKAASPPLQSYVGAPN
ncbi:MAG TPA: discoidin domain-containing protein [Dongiaceae bacterium]